MDVVLASALVIKDRSILLLHRIDHDHYETPGGKLSDVDRSDPDLITRDDLLRCALRELSEEVDCIAEPYAAAIEHRFTLRDGRSAYVAKFPMRFVSGSLALREPIFDEARFVTLSEFAQIRLAPDLVELRERIAMLIDDREVSDHERDDS